MNFCIISPIAGLERYATLSRTHLLLAQINAPGYWKFYERMIRERGDFIILDNGAYEGECDRVRLLNRINRIQPNVVVLPDILGGNWKSSSRESFSFLEDYYYSFPNTKWMYIPQAEPGDIIGFVESLFRAIDDSRIAYIGLPRALSYSITSDLTMRVRIAEQIRKRSSRVKIHALGMVRGSVEECRLLREGGCVMSIDSNAPVWRGWNGWTLDEVRYRHNESPQRWPETPVDYNAKFPEDDGRGGACVDIQILKNLEACGVDTNIHNRAGDRT